MNVHYLELFYYVAKFGGITAAVRRMPYGIQQPAVSAQLLKLEEQLNTRLFQRRPFALTSPGQELYDFIEPFFSGLPRLGERISGRGDQHLRLGASTTVLGYFLPAILDRIKKPLPDLKITLRQLSPLDVEQALLGDELDLAITAPGVAASRLKKKTLLKIPLVLLVPESSRWKTFGDLRRMANDTFITEPLIGVPPHEPLNQLFEEGLVKQGVQWPVQLEVNQMELVPRYVSHGFGCGVYPDVPGWPLAQGVRALPLKGFPLMDVAVVHRGHLSPVGKQLVDLCVKVANGMSGDS